MNRNPSALCTPSRNYLHHESLMGYIVCAGYDLSLWSWLVVQGWTPDLSSSETLALQLKKENSLWVNSSQWCRSQKQALQRTGSSCPGSIKLVFHGRRELRLLVHRCKNEKPWCSVCIWMSTFLWCRLGHIPKFLRPLHSTLLSITSQYKSSYTKTGLECWGFEHHPYIEKP